jgi:hypothetical protein
MSLGNALVDSERSALLLIADVLLLDDGSTGEETEQYS